MENGWIGVDLDGTLAKYDGWKGIDHIGPPIPLMVDRVKAWLKAGQKVRIFTARVCEAQENDVERAISIIHAWCTLHIGVALPVTCTKDFNMIELWDDRCKQVEPNTGRTVYDRALTQLEKNIRRNLNMRDE